MLKHSWNIFKDAHTKDKFDMWEINKIKINTNQKQTDGKEGKKRVKSILVS